MKVKCIKQYNDTLLGKTINVGEILEVSNERAKVLIEHNVAEETKEETFTMRDYKKKKTL